MATLEYKTLLKMSDSGLTAESQGEVIGLYSCETSHVASGQEIDIYSSVPRVAELGCTDAWRHFIVLGGILFIPPGTQANEGKQAERCN